jgi:hypothetical protein
MIAAASSSAGAMTISTRRPVFPSPASSSSGGELRIYIAQVGRARVKLGLQYSAETELEPA